MIYVIIACHNRKNLTLRAVESATAAAGYAQVPAKFIVFDDGSTDGTAEALLARDSSISVLRGDGSDFWASGMAKAERVALQESTHDDDYILWLNDDVTLDESAIADLLGASIPDVDSVVVGATRDPYSGKLTYSGQRRGGVHPLNFRNVSPNGNSQRVETFNGNCVLVRCATARNLGGIDGNFSHGMADTEYGLRCGRASVPVILAGRTIGTCARNPLAQYSSISDAWRAFVGPKGSGEPQSLIRILRIASPLGWPLYLLATYALWWARAYATKLRALWPSLRTRVDKVDS